MFLERTLFLINKAGINKHKLTTDLKISKNSFVDWEKGRSPKYETIEKIATYFNVSTDYLLGKTENPTTTNDSEVSDLQDPVTAEILDIMTKLSPEGRELVLSQIRSLAHFEQKKDK